MRLILILFALLLTNAMLAAEISGKADGFEGKFIRLYVLDDYISFKEVKVDVNKVQQDGSFALNAYIIHPSIAKIRIEDKTFEVLIMPDMELEVGLSFDEEANRTRIFDKILDGEILNNSDKGVNALINQYQTDYATFLEEHHQKLVTKTILPEVHKFQERMKAKYSDAPSYFLTYLDYDLAALEDAVLGSEKKVYVQHLEDRPIRYHNNGYMGFFAQFFQERFIQISQGKDGFQLLSAVNGTQNYSKMMEILKGHPYVFNDTIAQLFAIMGLKEVFGDETFKKPKVLDMLSLVQKNALNRENEQIAENVIQELTYMRQGQQAPEFNLRNREGEVHHLSDYSDKPVLLFFWSAYSNSALRYLDLLQEYHKKYGPRLNILAINVDLELTRALNYLESKKFGYEILFRDEQFDLQDKYRFFGGQSFMLLDKGGVVFENPAKNPEENLEADLFRLTSE